MVVDHDRCPNTPLLDDFSSCYLGAKCGEEALFRLLLCFGWSTGASLITHLLNTKAKATASVLLHDLHSHADHTETGGDGSNVDRKIK